MRAFFSQDKIADYQIPINLRKWFPCGRVSTKRYEIQQLLLRLMDEQNINVENLRLPPLNLTPRHRRSYYDTDDMDEFGEMDYDEEDEDEDDDIDPGYVYENVEGSLRLRRLRRSRYIHEHELDEEEGAFIDAEDDEDGDEEMVLQHGGKYEMFDSDEESGEMDGDSDEENSDDCLYENMNIEQFRAHVYGRDSLVEEDEEEERIEEEDEEEEEEDEEKITNNKLNSLNKEVVTISKLPMVMVPTSSSSNSSGGGGGDQSSVVATVTDAGGENKTKKSIEDLKKLRPWSKGAESGKESGCSARKKSRLN